MYSQLLSQYLSELKKLAGQLPILDLACGSGRNGLFCLEQELTVTFADIKLQPLDDIQQIISREDNNLDLEQASFWQVDLETNASQLKESSYSSIMIFRYLHRPLIEQMKAAVVPNGLVIYETFTIEQAEIGRPKNPNFLLKPGELASFFSDWQVLHYFEGIKVSDTGSNKQAVAQIVARKPCLSN